MKLVCALSAKERSVGNTDAESGRFGLVWFLASAGADKKVECGAPTVIAVSCDGRD